MAYINKIFNQDSRNMKELPADSVDLMITSPPYNVTKQYDKNLTLREYLQLVENVLKEAYRVLKPSGIVAINVANVGRKPYIPLDCYIIQILQNLHYTVFQELIWNKSASAGGSCAWGSWQSASNPCLRDVHEYIILAVKPEKSTEIRLPFDGFGNIPPKLENRSLSLNGEEYFSTLWEFGTESATRVNHPAPFPIELPYRIILMYSKKKDLILDPFIGSGSVAIAALIAGRRYVGYDTEVGYINAANERISNYLNLKQQTGRKIGKKRN